MFHLSVRLAVPALLLSAAASLSAGQALVRAAAESNVNQRYLIESVSVAGVELDQWQDPKLPSGLRAQMHALVGEHCDMTLIAGVATQLRKELHLRAVREHLSRGSAPDRIRVNFEVVRRDVGFDISVPKFLYHSRQGWTGEVDASTRIRQNTFTAGVLSNGDDLTERFGGFTAHYDNSRIGADRVRFGFGFETYHEQWNRTTRNEIAGSGLDLYRARRNLQPEVTFVVAKPLTVTVGASFEQMQLDGQPAGAPAQNRSANAATAQIHYFKRIEGDTLQQEIDGRYNLRSGLHALGSDSAYTRHKVTLKYEVKTGRQSASDEFTGGSISGNAPLFERFVLGSSSTLRGWNRYDIDPLGGSRVVHNSMTYGYQFGEGTGEVFYDTGSLWHSGTQARLRHSLGIGYRQGIFILTMAFPVHEGRIMPVFMVGMNY